MAPDGAGGAIQASARERLPDSGTVCLYAALAYEAPTDRLAADLIARGAALAFPRVVGTGLVLGRVDDPSELRSGYRGVLEPSPGAAIVPPGDVTAFCVPGFVFDRRGYRVGHGGGRYDRLLAQASPRARLVGLCYADRVVERVPDESWDVPVRLLVTEREVIET